MKGLKLTGEHSGYVAWDPCAEVPELKHLGEEWAFPDYAVPNHRHNSWEFHLQVTGETSWVIDRKALTLHACSLVGIAPRVEHRLGAGAIRKPHHFCYCALDLEVFNRRNRPLLHRKSWSKSHFIIANAEEFVPPFRTLNYEAVNQRRHRAAMIAGAVRTIAYLLDRHHLPEDVERKTFETDLTLQKSKEYIHARLNSKLQIDGLASAVGVSRSHLFHLFREKLGISPFEYYSERKILLSLEMIRAGELSLTGIALELGFSSSQHFSAAFKKRFGKSPSAYMKKNNE